MRTFTTMALPGIYDPLKAKLLQNLGIKVDKTDEIGYHIPATYRIGDEVEVTMDTIDELGGVFDIVVFKQDFLILGAHRVL